MGRLSLLKNVPQKSLSKSAVSMDFFFGSGRCQQLPKGRPGPDVTTGTSISVSRASMASMALIDMPD